MENKDEYIAYLEDKIVQLEKRLAKVEPTEEEVNNMAKDYSLIGLQKIIDNWKKKDTHTTDAIRYTVPETGQYTLTYSGTGEGQSLTYEMLQNIARSSRRWGR